MVLQEDRPVPGAGSAGGGGASATMPMNCHIDQLYISRGLDGVYYITSESVVLLYFLLFWQSVLLDVFGTMSGSLYCNCIRCVWYSVRDFVLWLY